MGSVCSKTKPKTKVIVVVEKKESDFTKFEIVTNIDKIGHDYQQQLFFDRQFLEWEKLLQETETYTNDKNYIKMCSEYVAADNHIIRFDLHDIEVVQKLPQLITNQKVRFEDETTLKLYVLCQQQNKLYINTLMKGVPANLRWKAWMALLFNQEIYDPDIYKKLSSQSTQYTKDDIQKDIYRTMPQFVYFSKDQNGPIHLEKVLIALAIQNQEVGYVQGMNQIAAFTLIINNGRDEESFWLMNFLAKNKKFLIFDIFKAKFEYLNLLMDIFEKNFEEQSPMLYEHFKVQGVVNMQYIFSWILTLFIYQLPIKMVIRFWDYILASNILSVITLSLSVINSYGHILLNENLEGIQNFFTNFKNLTVKTEVIEKIIQHATQTNLKLNLKSCYYSELIRNNFQIKEPAQQQVIENLE